jgi:hypothetical protein
MSSHSSSTNIDNPRTAKLRKHFDLIISGKQDISPHNNKLFLESICAQQDPATCINKLITSKNGLKSLQAAMRFELSTTFFNGPATTLLKYIQAPDLLNIGGGSFLKQTLFSIVEPPIFWSSFAQAFQAKTLQDDAQHCFAWLLFQLISLPKEESKPYRDLVQDPGVLDLLLSSSQYETRSIGQKIKHILATHSLGAPVDDVYSPGGRHDNDFVDFRDIAILPTAKEIMSSQQVFLRPSKVLDDPGIENESLLAIYLDNQFRLLREDMVHEMRDELRITLDKKKGPYRCLFIDGLKPLGIYCGTDPRKCKWGITFSCDRDLKLFQNVKPEDRKAYLADNRNILRHQSMTCLLIDGEVVAFSTFNRNEEFLARRPPVVTLQLEGEATTVRALLKLKTAKHIKIVQINTAVFSFEPILKALQEIQSLPLSQELVFWRKGGTITSPQMQQRRVMDIIEAIRADPHQDLQGLLGTTRGPIILDKSQATSLLSGLTQSVSLIQGPPGMINSRSVYNSLIIWFQGLASHSSAHLLRKSCTISQDRQFLSSATQTTLSINSLKISLT